MEYENENQFHENMINDMNDFNKENNEYNQYNEDNQYAEENNNEDGEIFENDIYELNEVNYKLKNKCDNLYNTLIIKNKELEKYKREYKKLQQGQSLYIKNIQKLKNELNLAKQKYFEVLKDIKLKNKIILDLNNGINIKDINIEKYKSENEENIILSINEQIKNIQKDFFEEESIEKPTDNYNINEFQNMEKSNQIQVLMNTINLFSEKLNKYKKNYMKEIINLKNKIESNKSNNFIVKDQFYLKINDIIKNLCSNFPNQGNYIGKFPNFSLNDENDIKSNNILIIIKILADYIISNKNKNENFNINEELNKRLKEMSELLIKSNENITKIRKENMELKKKYKEIELKYNTLINKSEKSDTNNKDIVKDNEKLKDDLYKKNQEIKSLEHMITRLTNKVEKNEENKNEDNSIPGKIIVSKNNNLYSQYNKFIIDEKNEKNLQKFLNKFTNGEYYNSLKKKINLDSLKEEVEKLDQKINKELQNKK